MTKETDDLELQWGLYKTGAMNARSDNNLGLASLLDTKAELCEILLEQSRRIDNLQRRVVRLESGANE